MHAHGTHTRRCIQTVSYCAVIIASRRCRLLPWQCLLLALGFRIEKHLIEWEHTGTQK